MGMKPTGTGARLSEEAKTEIIKLRAEDPKRWTFCALAEKFGATDGAVFRVVKLGGGTVGSKGKPAPRAKRAPDATAEAAKRLAATSVRHLRGAKADKATLCKLDIAAYGLKDLAHPTKSRKTDCEHCRKAFRAR